MGKPKSGKEPTGLIGAAENAFGTLDACHRRTLAALEEFREIVARLDAGLLDEVTRALASGVVRHFSTTAREHHEDEERHVFPALAASGDPAVREAVLRLQQDHCWLEEDWLELQPQVDAIACGQSWFDPAVLREGAEIFIALSREHIALEETCLYPQARASLGPTEQQEMRREMTARRRAARATGGAHRRRPQP